MTDHNFDAAAANRHFSTDCFNRVWDLLDKPDRSADDDRLMVSMCHASLFHWQQRPDCSSRNLSIGYWQLSRVYAVLGQADNARQFARVCRTHSENEEPFYLGYAYEALARAEFTAGNADAGEYFLANAREQSVLVADAEERGMLDRELQTMKATARPDRQRLISHVDVVRESLLAEIHDVFRDVSREGGVTWGESVLMDMGGQFDESPRPDNDTHWSQLVDDESWQPQPGIGGFCFLDPIGFRYYLPPVLIRCIRSGCDEGIQDHLSEASPGFMQHRLEQLSLLDHRQRRCVARFLLYMSRKYDTPYWFGTLNEGWWQYLDAEGPPPRIE